MSKNLLEVFIKPNGDIKFIYDDDLAHILMPLGNSWITRQAFVEPWYEDNSKWYVDLGSYPSFGPFDTRREALEAEKEWVSKLLATE